MKHSEVASQDLVWRELAFCSRSGSVGFPMRVLGRDGRREEGMWCTTGTRLVWKVAPVMWWHEEASSLPLDGGDWC